MGGPGQRKILVADDSATVREMLKGLLEDNGFNVICANDGEEAIQKAAVDSPDLILLDVVMCGKDGFTTHQELKDSPQTQKIPVIFLTTRDKVTDMYEGLRLGAVEYVTKPYEPKDLLDKIYQALKMRAT